MKVNVSITFLLFSTHRYNLNSITLSDLQGDNVLAKDCLRLYLAQEKACAQSGTHYQTPLYSVPCGSVHLAYLYMCMCVCYRNYFHDSNVSNDNMKSTVVIKQQKIITGIFSSPWFYSVLQHYSSLFSGTIYCSVPTKQRTAGRHSQCLAGEYSGAFSS